MNNEEMWVGEGGGVAAMGFCGSVQPRIHLECSALYRSVRILHGVGVRKRSRRVSSGHTSVFSYK